MTKNIQDKIDEIFSDEYINNKRLLFSPKKLSQSKTYKNNDKNKDNRINATVKVEKSTETTNYRTSSSKTRKQHIKNINENPDGNKPILKALNDMEKNKENNLANEINDKKELKRELTLKIRQKKKEEKEEKEKQEKEKQEKEKQEKEKRERKEKEKEKKENQKININKSKTLIEKEITSSSESEEDNNIKKKPLLSNNINKYIVLYNFSDFLLMFGLFLVPSFCFSYLYYPFILSGVFYSIIVP